MAPIRRSTRARRATGTQPERPRPAPIPLYLERPEPWVSPLSPHAQISVHGHLPISKPDLKRQTTRGAFVSLNTRGVNFASTDLPSSQVPRRKPAKKTPARKEVTPSPAAATVQQDSAEVVATSDHSTLPLRSSKTVSLASSPHGFAATLDTLSHPASHPMTPTDQDTPLVNSRGQCLEAYSLSADGEMGDTMNVQSSEVDEEGISHRKRVSEAKVTEWLEREMEYREEVGSGK